MARITVPAFCRNSRLRSRTVVSTDRHDGMRYGGSSMTYSGRPPLRTLRLRAHATAMAAMMPRKYSAKSVMPGSVTKPTQRFGTNAPMSSAYTGSRALHDMNGAIMMVVKRSRRLSMLRVAMMPGMAQAKDESSGMNERPDSPTLAITRSMMNAARAMYPLSSSTQRNMKRMAICGTKVSVVPTPAMTPSTSSERRAPAGIACPTTLPNQLTAASMRFMSGCAQANTDWKTAPIKTTKITGPHTRCVSTRSMASRRESRRSPGATTASDSNVPMAS